LERYDDVEQDVLGTDLVPGHGVIATHSENTAEMVLADMVTVILPELGMMVGENFAAVQ